MNAHEIWHKITNFDGVWCFHYAGDYKLEKLVKDGGKMRWHKHQYKSAEIVQGTLLSCDRDTQLKMWKGGDEVRSLLILDSESSFLTFFSTFFSFFLCCFFVYCVIVTYRAIPSVLTFLLETNRV